MKSKTEAVIISSMNLGEADKLATFFSLDRGKLKGVAKTPGIPSSASARGFRFSDLS